jgi:protein TonB
VGRQAIFEELDNAIDQVIDGRTPHVRNDLNELVQLAGKLRVMPSADFRARLRSDLEDQALFIAAGRTYHRERSTSKVLQMPRPMPTLFNSGPLTYPVNRTNFMMSFLLHTAALGLLIGSGAWFASTKVQLHQATTNLVELSPYVLPVSPDVAGGGGGGGDRDKVEAPKGRLLRQSNQQFTPPAIVIRNVNPKLAIEPTVVAPKVNIAANMPNLGDPYSRIPNGPASNGTGSGSGIGAGSNGGIGAGYGTGIGAGTGGGIGGGVFRVGGGVSAPRVLYSPDPDYSEEARKAKYQGTVILWVIVGSDGRAREAKIARSLGMGLDEKALAAVRQWKFEPAMKDGRPVAVQINVEMNFRLY